MYILPVCQILRNVIEGNARADDIKYRNTLKFSFERAQITLAFVLSARAIVKLKGATLNPRISSA